jgi:hypothetical protein
VKRRTFASSILAAALPAAAQTAPVIQSAFAKETVINGAAAAGSGPIVVYSLSFPVKTKLGQGNVGADGKFAVALKQPLIQGHRLVAEDKSKRVSAEFAVPPPRSSPAGTP